MIASALLPQDGRLRPLLRSIAALFFLFIFLLGVKGLGTGFRLLGDDLVQGFSRGMCQRLALERVLLHQPRLILLDEPYTGLDEAAGRTLVERLRALREDRRMVLLATHDLEAVEGFLDRVVILRKGRLMELADVGGSLRHSYRAELSRLNQL